MNRRQKLEQMLQSQPNDPFLHYALAMEWTKEGQADHALSRFDAALGLDPGYLAAYYHKANVLISQSRMADAQATLVSGITAARARQDAHAESEMQALLGSLAL